MKNDDVMGLLKAADPARQLNIQDSSDMDELREEIIRATPRQQQTRPARRRVRVGLASVAALALVGSGVAYATYERLYGGGGGDGSLTCSDGFLTIDSDRTALRVAGGPTITGDPITDCVTYREAAGYPTISDPIAVAYNGSTWVVPRTAAEDPQWADDVQPFLPAQDPSALALADHINDYVDGGYSRCFDRSNAHAFFEETIADFGVDGWSFRMGSDNRPYEEGPCGFFMVFPTERVVEFLPDRGENPDLTDSRNAEVGVLVRGLRSEIAQQCLTIEEAQATLATLMPDAHHWPTAAIPVPNQECTTVDLLVGGSLQVKLRGPE
ncbi:hypothetical protein [Ornithinimicrobium faecis]|uniref:hypothetical protein n=1 Tax=Ornithinimicrobium faecis TaxID=2934158 RepID=UPI002117D5C8|nr:hypothetical protein [Ornithinimicrobium sp. HY1745]